MTESPQRDVIAILTHDHREFEELFAHLDKLPRGDAERRELADQLTIELVRHSVAEEMHLYPAVREHVPGGAQLADREIAEHAQAEQLLKTLEGLGVEEPEFDNTLTELMQAIRNHVQEEENTLFPALSGALDEPDLIELGAKVESAKRTAPTRPHPAAPDTPPWNRILAPGTGLVDRLRDALSGRGH